MNFGNYNLTASRYGQQGHSINRFVTVLRRPLVWLFLLVFLCAGTNVSAQFRPSARVLDAEAGLSVILLGTGVPIPNPDRATACTEG